MVNEDPLLPAQLEKHANKLNSQAF